MKKMSQFQIILIAAFLASAVFAVMIFAGLIPVGNKDDSTKAQGNVIIWGTFSNFNIQKALEWLDGGNADLNINYIQKPVETYQQALIEAFASDVGPDLFFLTPDMILKNEKFIFKFPYESYPEKTFKDSFIDGADIYLTNDGVVALPVVVDPLVLYYNKDILANNGVASVPQNWDDLFNLNETLTDSDDDGVINQSMISLGRFDNITHAKDILVMLLMQSGNPIIQRDEDKDKVDVLFDYSFGLSPSPVISVFTFFSEFSNTSYSSYSWNKTLPESKDYFTANNLAFYLGKASELFEIESVNPNLSFDVAEVLQTKNTNKKTFGDIYAIAINKKSTNLNTSFIVAGRMSTGDNAKKISTALSLPPASKLLLNDKPQDSYMHTFYNAAIVSDSWLDPNENITDDIFEEIMSNILSNRLLISDAINKAQNQLELLTQ
ncbi:MAG: extracellular solute-binding protein [Patescibacteria group bacterium]|nr:extracellular solute-binding protein [Patescibacteria group bacterium]